MNIGSAKSYSKDWWIVFTPSKHKEWFLRFLNQDFGHCYMLTKTPGETLWVKLDPTRSNVDIDFFSTDEHPTARDIEPYGVILPLTVKLTGSTSIRGIKPVTCVEFCKEVMGVNSFWTLTPYQLYKGITGGRYERTF